MRTNYDARIRQRHLYANLGLRLAQFGVALFVIGLVGAFAGPSSLIGLSVFGVIGTSFGISFALIFGQVGWTDNRLADVILNQLSVVVSVIGFLVVIFGTILLDPPTMIRGIGTFIIGIILALIGIRFQTYR